MKRAGRKRTRGGRGGGQQKQAPARLLNNSKYANSEIAQQFKAYSGILDENNDRRERIVKLSRDITIYSKRLIFQMHRCLYPDIQNEWLDSADESLAAIHMLLINVAKEIEGHDYWRYQRAFSPGLQEYIEAISFYHYMKTGNLISAKQIEERIAEDYVSTSITALSPSSSSYNLKEQQAANDGDKEGSEDDDDTKIKDKPIDANNNQTITLRVNHIDYLLGIADLTGELMRRAVNLIAVAEYHRAASVGNFLHEIYEACITLPHSAHAISSDWTKKLEVMEQSVKKVENVCFTANVRISEFPDHKAGISASLLVDIDNDHGDQDFRDNEQ